jgi:hypothetical protein
MDFKCQCGATCSADEAQAGQTVKCAACGQDVPVPTPAEALASAVSEEAAEGELLAVDTRSAQEAAREQFPKGDVDEMIFQLTGRRPGEAPPPPKVKPQEKVATDVAAAVAGAPEAPPVERRPKTQLDFARHHYGFKRIFWPIGLGVGLLLLAMAVWGFWPRGFHNYDEIQSLEDLVKEQAPEIEHPVLYTLYTHDYAVEKGAEIVIGKDSSVSFKKDGMNIPALPVDEWAVDYHAVEEQQRAKFMHWIFGGVCALIGGMLIFLGAWMLRDVRLVRSANAEETPAEETAAAAGSTDSGDDSAVAELIPDDEAKK